MRARNATFNVREVLHELKHYLPAQAPLKDFIYPNPLHVSQQDHFHAGLQKASEIYGFKVSLSLNEFRAHYEAGRVKKEVLERIITQKKGQDHVPAWLEKAISKKYSTNDLPRIGSLRAFWKQQYQLNLDSLVQPTLFRILSGFLDQGIAKWTFPVQNQPFLVSMREMERTSFTSFFRTERAKNLLLYTRCDIGDLLHILVGDESLYTHYLFDQQFAHQGWSGMVSVIEDQPETLLDTRYISLHDLILFELLLEIDALDFTFGEIWAPLGTKIRKKPRDIFAPLPETELAEIISIWQEAFEWSYYDAVLTGILGSDATPHEADRTLQPEVRKQSRASNTPPWMKALFGPRPQPTFPAPALCLMGTPALTRPFLSDRRVSLRAFDCRADPTGRYLLDALKSAGQDSPPGFPNPSIQAYEPLRRLLVVEHFPDIVQEIIKTAPEIDAWFRNEWIHLVVMHPEKKILFVFRNGVFAPYITDQKAVHPITDVGPMEELAPGLALFLAGIEQRKSTSV